MASLDWWSDFPLFEGLRSEVLEFLRSGREAWEPAPGEVVLLQDDLGDDLYLIEAGEVEVIRDLGTEREARVAVLAAPDFFGEIAVLECVPRTASVRARESCRLHRLHSTELFELYQRWPDQYALVLHRLARAMTRRLLQENRELRRGANEDRDTA